jgi:hypothetical protein
MFKLLHATKLNPLIKHNASSRQEDIYRLYTEKTSLDGRKIPFLKKAMIFKLMKNIGKNKSVSIYIESEDSNISYLSCEFNEHGHIVVVLEMHRSFYEIQVNEIIQKQLNPIIQEINNVLQQSGIKLDTFKNLSNSNIEINQITYETKIKVKSGSLNFKPYNACFSSIFSNELNTQLMDSLRFRRVSNYNKLTSQQAFVLEKIKDNSIFNVSDIVNDLLNNFKNDFT